MLAYLVLDVLFPPLRGDVSRQMLRELHGDTVRFSQVNKGLQICRFCFRDLYDPAPERCCRDTDGTRNRAGSRDTSASSDSHTAAARRRHTLATGGGFAAVATVSACDINKGKF